MKYAKIIVKSNYDKRCDLVLRSYVRALKKIGESRLLSGDNAFIYGVIDDNNVFHELFTNEVIDFDEYVYVDVDELFEVANMSDARRELMTKIVQKVLFKNPKVYLDFDVTTLEEQSQDHYVEFEAYENHLSGINPYPRLLPTDDQSYMMAYDILRHKIEAIKKMRQLDRKTGIDEYDINNYESISHTGGQYVKK